MARRKTDISLATAKKLTEEIISGLVVTAEKIEKFIAGRGWIAMGYDGFPEWYDSEGLAQLTLGQEIRPHIVYAMLGEGKSDIDIALSIKGVGPENVRALRRQKANGVPARYTTVRRHSRRTPAKPPEMLHLHIGPRKLAAWRKREEHEGRSVEDIAIELLNSYFK